MNPKYHHAINHELSLLHISNELARLVELKKAELEYTIRFNLTEEEKKRIDEI